MAFVDWLKYLFGKGAADFKFAAASVSARGLVRKDNQDHLVSLPEEGFFCVADGMGGGKGGALASQWVCDGLSLVVRSPEYSAVSGAGRTRFAIDAIQQANDRIRMYAREQGYKSMGSTVAFLVFDPNDWSHPAIVHAGDSRIYRLRRGELQQLTRDHTVGVELSRKTHSRAEAQKLGARSNPLTHILTRAVGTEFRVRPDRQTIDAKVGDRYLLCTDGVHDMLSDEEIAAAMRGWRRPEEIIRRLEKGIIAAGAGDNYSLVCIEVRRQRPSRQVNP